MYDFRGAVDFRFYVESDLTGLKNTKERNQRKHSSEGGNREKRTLEK